MTQLGPATQSFFMPRISQYLTAEWLAIACAMSVSGAARADAVRCEPPVPVSAIQPKGNGDAILLKWVASQGSSRFRIWAQWRVPEGEVLHTHEVVVEDKEVQLPPSPARWRPLKLSIEMQTLCEGGALSTVAPLRQLQYDAAAEAACPPVEGVRFDSRMQRVVWNGEPHDRVLLSFHRVGDGQAQGQQEVVGTLAVWPAQVGRPAVIRVVRACAEPQRSRATFLLVR